MVLAVLFSMLSIVVSAQPASALQSAATSPILTGPAAVAPAVVAETAGPMRAPNLVLISIDTLRRDHTSVHGYGVKTTPNLEALASDGVRLNRAYSHTPTTGPSHTTMLTSLYPMAHGMLKNGERLSASVTTLAEILRGQGYATAAFVSSYVLAPVFGLNQGFDSYDASFEPSSKNGCGCSSSQEERCADEVTASVLDWFEVNSKRTQPFFLFIHYFDPHAGYDPPPGFGAPSIADDSSLSPLLRLERRIEDYDGEVRFTDQQVGLVLKEIDQRGLRNDTLVVVTSDHGESFGENGVIGHGVALYETMISIPLVLRFPGTIPPGLSSDEPVGLIDITPTILDLIGVEIGGRGFQGKSLVPLITGKRKAELDVPIFLQRRHYTTPVVRGVRVEGSQFAVRTKDWKYVEDGQGQARLLFNLSDDPGELKNLVADRPAQVKRLSTMVKVWKKRNEPSHPLAEQPGVSEGISPKDLEHLRALGYVR